MESKAVFVLVTARNCPHCTNFRKNWAEIKRALVETGLIETPIDIEVNSLSEAPDPTVYPPDLKRWVTWYPNFLLFTKKSWQSAQPGLNGSLEGHIFNGTMEGNMVKYLGNGNPTRENLVAWVKSRSSSTNKVNPMGSSAILSMLAAGSSSNASTTSTTLTPGMGVSAPIQPTSNPITITDARSANLKFIPTSSCKFSKIRLMPRN